MPQINRKQTPHPDDLRNAAAAAVLVLLVACRRAGGLRRVLEQLDRDDDRERGRRDIHGHGHVHGHGSPPARAASRFKALRECLQKNGITLPKRTPGQRPPGGFLGGAGGPQLPAGVTRAQYQAAVKKCGGAAFAGAGRSDQKPRGRAGACEVRGVHARKRRERAGTEHVRQRSGLQHQRDGHRPAPSSTRPRASAAPICRAPSGVAEPTGGPPAGSGPGGEPSTG